MSQNTQEDSKGIPSVVQPGSVLHGSLPNALSEKLTRSKKPATQGAYSDIYKGSLEWNGAEIAVCIKVLRRCNLETPCVDPNITVEDRFERVRHLRSLRTACLSHKVTRESEGKPKFGQLQITQMFLNSMGTKWTRILLCLFPLGPAVEICPHI